MTAVNLLLFSEVISNLQNLKRNGFLNEENFFHQKCHQAAAAAAPETFFNGRNFFSLDLFSSSGFASKSIRVVAI